MASGVLAARLWIWRSRLLASFRAKAAGSSWRLSNVGIMAISHCRWAMKRPGSAPPRVGGERRGGGGGRAARSGAARAVRSEAVLGLDAPPARQAPVFGGCRQRGAANGLYAVVLVEQVFHIGLHPQIAVDIVPAKPEVGDAVGLLGLEGLVVHVVEDIVLVAEVGLDGHLAVGRQGDAVPGDAVEAVLRRVGQGVAVDGLALHLQVRVCT